MPIEILRGRHLYGITDIFNYPTKPLIKMSPHGFIRFYLMRRQRILRRSLYIIVVRAYATSRSRFAAQFIDSHPVLTPRKIMSDRLMLPGYGKLCVTPLYFNVPLVPMRAGGIHTRCHQICRRNILVWYFSEWSLIAAKLFIQSANRLFNVLNLKYSHGKKAICTKICKRTY